MALSLYATAMANDFPKYGSKEWKLYQYKRALEARRGHNYTYDDGTIADDLERKGYVLHDVKPKHASVGNDICKELRKEGYFARMLLYTSAVRGYPDVVIYKKRKRGRQRGIR